MVDTQELNTFNEFVDACRVVHDETGGTVWFRGHSSSAVTWKLQPSVFRDTTFASASIRRTRQSAENNMAHNFRVHAPLRYTCCPSMDDLAGWLSLMQHHELPTRLLDWTEAPLTALFFAMEERKDETTTHDKVIWALKPLALNQIMMDKIAVYGLWESNIRDFIAPVFDPVFDSTTGNITNNPPQEAVAVHASEIDMRMLMQQSTFTLHTTDRPLENNNEAHNFLNKFVIPVGRVGHFRGALKALSIRRSHIYPDLTNLAREIRAVEAGRTVRTAR